MRIFISIAFAVLVAATAIGCSPQIGDGCSNASNCSINGDRACDVAQPGGYCTVFECQPDSCPDEAVCARFNPQPARRAITACMRRCGSDSDCRGEYRCASVEELAATGLEVQITDTARGPRFCVARVVDPVDGGPGTDAGVGDDAGTDEDAGSDAGIEDDAGVEDDAGPDAGIGDDAGPDAGIGEDAGPDAGSDADAAVDAGPDAA